MLGVGAIQRKRVHVQEPDRFIPFCSNIVHLTCIITKVPHGAVYVVCVIEAMFHHEPCARRTHWRRTRNLVFTMITRCGERAAVLSARAAGSSTTQVLQTRRLLTLSSVEGPKEPPLESRTLSVYFRDEILAKHADRPALVCKQEQPRAHGGPLSPNMGVRTHLAWDFHEFDRHIQGLARGLVSLGVQRGDRVAVLMGNNRCAFNPHWQVVLTVSSTLRQQRVCVVTMGVRERGCDLGDAQPCLPCARARESSLPGLSVEWVLQCAIIGEHAQRGRCVTSLCGPGSPKFAVHTHAVRCLSRLA